MADGEGPTTPDELSRAVEAAFQEPAEAGQPVAEAKPAPPYVDVARETSKPDAKEVIQRQDNQALQAVERTIEGLPAKISEAAQSVGTVAEPLVGAAQKAVKPTNPEMVIAELLDKPPAEQGKLLPIKREEHLASDPDDLKQAPLP